MKYFRLWYSLKTEFLVVLGIIVLCAGLGYSFYREIKFSNVLEDFKLMGVSQAIVVSTKSGRDPSYRLETKVLDLFSSVDDFEAFRLGKSAEAAYIESIGEFRIDPNDYVIRLLINPNSDAYAYGYIGRESGGVFYNFGSFRSKKLRKSMWFLKNFNVSGS